VPARLDCDLELGPDAVGGRQDQRVAVAGGLEVEKPGEAAEARIRARTARGGGERPDRVDQRLARVYVDARILVGVAFYGNTAGLYTR
jgi:hypothetical protein